MVSRVTIAAAILALVAFASAAPYEHGKRLIKMAEDEDPVWLTEYEVIELIRRNEAAGLPGVGFIDVTDRIGRDRRMATFRKEFPTQPEQKEEVLRLTNYLSADNLVSFLEEFSSFHNRYYTSDTGVESHVWLRDYMQAIADANGRNDTTCTLFEHSWAQPSVICRVEGTHDALKNEIVVCSAHSDSINSASPTNGRSPGVDDDGSGVSNFVEVFRAFMEGDFYPKRTVEFIGYAAEEVGLRGSGDIAASYVSAGKKVYGVYHNEMSGYAGSQRKITILQDYVDRELTDFLQSLVPVYSSLEYQTARCGYGCSDHASWTDVGVPAICTAEAGPFGDVNPEMHTADDDMDIFDAEFSLEFTKLALGMVVELAMYDA